MVGTGIYMDNHATTPLDPRVLEAMMPYLSRVFGNAASRSHGFGWEAEKAVETGRERIARLINAKPKEIVFTSGATESDNLALKGVAAAPEYASKARHVVTVATEHRAVLDVCDRLEAERFKITVLGVKDRPGVAAAIFEPLGAAGVSVGCCQHRGSLAEASLSGGLRPQAERCRGRGG